MGTATKVFHSGMAGAPQVSGTVGSLLAVLQACLVDGWGSATVDSLVIASGVATVTIGAGHPFEVDSVALMAGATTTGGSVNGERRVLSASATSYSFSAAGMPDQTATGTITHKVAPLGWAREFGPVSNEAVYRPTDTESTRMYLRVNDSIANAALTTGYQTMSAVDTGTGAFGGYYWTRSSLTDGTARPWLIVGDSRGFFIRTQPAGAASQNARHASYFGDFEPLTTPDAYRCVATGSGDAYTATTGTTFREVSWVGTSSVNMRIAATRDGLTENIFGRRAYFVPHRQHPDTSTLGYSGAPSADFVDYPNPEDNALLLSRLTVATEDRVRGYFPGIYCTPQAVRGVIADREKLVAALGLAGETLMAVETAQGMFFLSLGDWR